ncbi:MAG: hypothetical protein LBF97_08405 [Elusimicrobiota bacterium]|jgi:hypothetical protein|nr:hypothetical protein [Elusimicrobiota bacterium]
MNKRKREPNKYITENYILDDEINIDPFELKHKSDYNPDIYDVKTIKDYKLPLLHKKYFRPYFSPKFNSWEMDFMIVPFKDGKSPFVELDDSKEEKHTQFYYLFVININTKYLYVSPTLNKDTNSVTSTLYDMISHENLQINNIRGDDDVAFDNHFLKQWLSSREITYYFTPHIYTNRNRIVDRVMRTIRDMFDQLGHRASLFDVKLMEKIVYKYNHTTHRAFDYRFTPVQVQNNKDLERIFIARKMDRLQNIPKNVFNKYEYGDIILVHIPFKEINYKRRRNFTHLGMFIEYVHGNVKCYLLYPEGDDYTDEIVVIPPYYTKFVNNLNQNFRNYFNLDK